MGPASCHTTISHHRTHCFSFTQPVKGSLPLIPVPLLPLLEHTWLPSCKHQVYTLSYWQCLFLLVKYWNFSLFFWKRNNKFPFIPPVLHSYFSKISTHPLNQNCSGFMFPVFGESANGKNRHQGILQLISSHDPKWSNIHESQVHILWLPAYVNTQNSPTLLTVLKDSIWQEVT